MEPVAAERTEMLEQLAAERGIKNEHARSQVKVAAKRLKAELV